MTTPSHVEVEARSYELDPYGHLNNAVFINWLEHGRLAYLRDRCMSYTSIPEEYGVHVVVVHQDVAFKAQVLLGDRLVMTSRVVRFGQSSFAFEQAIRFVDSDRPACEATVTMVCVGPDERPIPMPGLLRERLAT
ncbi:MAG: acyl-CoA thioesterase [Planctomycetota bacterium]